MQRKLLNRDGFEEWLFFMSDKLDEFTNKLNDNNSGEMDFTLSSLDVLEKMILLQYPSKEVLLQEENKDILDLYARYVGETFRKNLKVTKWDIDLSNEKNAYYRLPVITGKELSVPIAPHTLLTASIGRNKGNFISTVLSNNIKQQTK